MKIDKSKDRAHLLELAYLMDAVANVHRDECHDWCLAGKHGHVYHVATGSAPVFQALVGVDEGMQARGWTNAKARLADFCVVCNDGDTEGTVLFSDYPTPEQAVELRKILGIRKRPELSEGQRAARRESFNLKLGKEPAYSG
jgi:hypothetical protein